MATPYTSFGTRRALGRRYSVDPALLLESERLAQEYALAPGREARALQASQFGQSLATQREQMAGAERGGMVGTFGNLATSAGVLRAMTLAKGEPFFGGLFGGGAAATKAAPGAFTIGGTYGAAGATGLGGAGAAPFVVNPALMGEGAVGLTAGAAPAGAGVPAVAGATPAAGAGAGLGFGAVAGGGAIGGFIGAKLGQPIGEALGIGGKAERSIVGGALGGAGAGALIGAQAGSVGGPVGALVGAGVGALVGFVSKIFGW